MEEPGVLQSAEFIVKHATNVSISSKGVENAVEFIIEETRRGTNVRKERESLEPNNLSEEETLEWYFLLDTLNFCFWCDQDEELFTVDFRGKKWTGYRSMCAALCRAVEDGTPIHKPSFYEAITLQQLKEILHSCNGTDIPLLQERLECLHQAATTLTEKFDGKVTELIKQSDKSVQKLVHLLASNFPAFNDVSTFKGQKVAFFKRAQIFAGDVWFRFNGEGFGEFHDIDSLTMFADYRVPQSLVYLKILQYNDTLMETLQKQIHVAKGSEYEMEIRGSSIWAVELICRGLKERLAKDPSLCPTLSVRPCTVDFFLWEYAKQHPDELSHVPIHRTKTVFY